MAIPEYFIGKSVTSRVKFRDRTSGSLVDPGTVKYKLRRPNEVEDAVKTFGASDIVKNAVGDYQVKFTIDQAGLFKSRWNGTGGAVVSESVEDEVRGKESAFETPLA